MHQQTGAPKVPLGFVFEGRPSSLRAFVKKLGPGGASQDEPLRPNEETGTTV